jgi:hypothetical protein
MWSGYVGVYPSHPAFGKEIEECGSNFWCYTDEVHFIEPWPEPEGAVVDENDPKGSLLDTVRMPDYLWFIGFDFAHAGDLIPGVNGVLQRSLNRCSEKQLGTYKDLNYVKKTCATLALMLVKMTGTKTMDSTRQRVFAS